MCLLLNWQIVHCEFICISFSFVHAPVCANCNYSCNCTFIQKKKKKKNDPYFSMGKNTKSYPTIPAIYLFSWEREGILMSQNLTLKLSTSVLSGLLPARKRFRQSVDDTHQNCPKYVYFPANFAPFQ